MVVICFYFKKRQNLAIGIALSGVGVGIFALAPVTQFARDYYDNIGVFIFSAGIMAHEILFGVLCFPSSLERHLLFQRKSTRERLKQASMLRKVFGHFKPYLDVICNKGVVCLGMFLLCLGCYLIFLHLPTYIVLKGFSKIQAAMLLSLIGLVSIPGRVISGIVSDHAHPSIICSGSSAVIFSASFAFPFIATHFAGQVAFSVVYGLLYGAALLVTASLSLLFVDIKFLAAAIGLQYMFGGIGATIGLVLPGLIVDNGGSYDQSFVVAAFCTLIAALCGGVSNFYKRPEKDTGYDIVYKPAKEAV